MPSTSTSSRTSSIRLPSIQAAVDFISANAVSGKDPLARKRLLADLCRMLGDRISPRRDSSQSDRSPPAQGKGTAMSTLAVVLSPRVRQTLDRLLAGDSEKEIAANLRLSPHTVHVYVKTLYRRFGVCSRGELLARFVDRRNAQGNSSTSGAQTFTTATRRGSFL